jgi:hypothetical protein
MIIQKVFLALAIVTGVSATTLTSNIAEARGARGGGHFSTHFYGGHYGYRAPYGGHYGYRIPFGYGYRPYFNGCAYVNAWGQCVRSSYRYGW